MIGGQPHVNPYSRRKVGDLDENRTKMDPKVVGGVANFDRGRQILTGPVVRDFIADTQHQGRFGRVY